MGKTERDHATDISAIFASIKQVSAGPPDEPWMRLPRELLIHRSSYKTAPLVEPPSKTGKGWGDL